MFSEKKGPVSRPYTNRAARNTEGVLVMIDWCAFTFQGLSVSEVCGFLKRHEDGEGSEFVDVEVGALGYKGQKILGNVRVFFDGAPAMGVHVEVSGKGCRELESYKVTDWGHFFGEVHSRGGVFTRLDVAIDDRAGLVQMGAIKQAIITGDLVSRWRSGRCVTAFALGGEGGMQGETFYFGSAQSRIQLRIYDKAAEQGVVGEHWVRVELQARRERADSLAWGYLFGADEFVAGILRSYLEFKQRSGDSNKSRWPIAGWWDAFLGHVAEARLATAAAVRTLEGSILWLKRQVAPTLAMLVECSGGDLGPLLKVMATGQVRYRSWHRNIIAACAAGG